VGSNVAYHRKETKQGLQRIANEEAGASKTHQRSSPSFLKRLAISTVIFRDLFLEYNHSNVFTIRILHLRLLISAWNRLLGLIVVTKVATLLCTHNDNPASMTAFDPVTVWLFTKHSTCSATSLSKSAPQVLPKIVYQESVQKILGWSYLHRGNLLQLRLCS
jgi:hypothetical protein